MSLLLVGVEGPPVIASQAGMFMLTKLHLCGPGSQESVVRTTGPHCLPLPPQGPTGVTGPKGARGAQGPPVSEAGGAW